MKKLITTAAWFRSLVLVQGSALAGQFWLCAFSLIILISGLASPAHVVAFDVCADSDR